MYSIIAFEKICICIRYVIHTCIHYHFEDIIYDVCVQGLAVGDHELKLVFAAPECREHMAFVYKYGLKITGEPRSLVFRKFIATIFYHQPLHFQ